MKNLEKRIKDFLINHLAILLILFVFILSGSFLVFGKVSENGSLTLDGSNAKIEKSTEQFIEDSQKALARIMNDDKSSDEKTIEENDKDAVGQGFHTTLEEILSRRRADGDNDNGNGWQCSKYTAYLATGKKDYSRSNPDYGPVHGKDIANWLVKNYGFKYIDVPVPGAIGSTGFNTAYGHTVMYVGNNSVNDANFSPLRVFTHGDNISNYVWVVPGNYNQTTTNNTTASNNTNSQPINKTNNQSNISTCEKIYVKKGDTMSGIMQKCEGKVNWPLMNDYAKKWYSTKVVPNQSVYDGWNSKYGVGLFEGDIIIKR